MRTVFFAHFGNDAFPKCLSVLDICDSFNSQILQLIILNDKLLLFVGIISLLLEMYVKHNANWHYILLLHYPIRCVGFHVTNQIYHAHFLLLFEVILHGRHTFRVKHTFGLVLLLFSVRVSHVHAFNLLPPYLHAIFDLVLLLLGFLLVFRTFLPLRFLGLCLHL